MRFNKGRHRKPAITRARHRRPMRTDRGMLDALAAVPVLLSLLALAVTR